LGGAGRSNSRRRVATACNRPEDLLQKADRKAGRPIVDLTPRQVRQLRTTGQHLEAPAEPRDIVEVVRSICGFNAQSVPAMKLSLRARIRGLEQADIEKAIACDKTLVRTWAMRGTLHLLDARDARWLVSSVAPSAIARGRRRREELGLDPGTLAQGLDDMRAVLGRAGPLTRRELAKRLVAKGLPIDAGGQAPIHLIAYAALQGLLCLGPECDGEPTYVLVDRWIGKGSGGKPSPDLTALVGRYLRGYGPADAADFAAWAGVTVADARSAFGLARVEGSTGEALVESRAMWVAGAVAGAAPGTARQGPVVRLLPAFDSYVLGYKDRDHLVPPEHRKDVYHGGQTVPVVLVDGLAAGVWRYQRRGRRLAIEVRPFGRFSGRVADLVSDEADDVGRFFGTGVSLTVSVAGRSPRS